MRERAQIGTMLDLSSSDPPLFPAKDDINEQRWCRDCFRLNDNRIGQCNQCYAYERVYFTLFIVLRNWVGGYYHLPLYIPPDLTDIVPFSDFKPLTILFASVCFGCTDPQQHGRGCFTLGWSLKCGSIIGRQVWQCWEEETVGRGPYDAYGRHTKRWLACMRMVWREWEAYKQASPRYAQWINRSPEASPVPTTSTTPILVLPKRIEEASNKLDEFAKIVNDSDKRIVINVAEAGGTPDDARAFAGSMRKRGCKAMAQGDWVVLWSEKLEEKELAEMLAMPIQPRPTPEPTMNQFHWNVYGRRGL